MAKTYKSIVINASGGSGASSPPYASSFTAAGSWSLNGSVYEISILESTHGQGANVIVQVYELVAGEYREIELDIIITSTGNVTIQVTASPDLRFDGKVIIKGD